MEIKENMLLQYRDNKTIRVIYCDSLSRVVHAIDVEKMRWPYAIDRDEIITDYQNKRITVLEADPYMRNVMEEELSEAEKDKRNRAWEIVSFVFQQLESEVLIYVTKYREIAMKRALGTYTVNYTTVKNYLIRHWQGGQIKNALLPHFHLCGAPGKEKSVSERKRGRPRQSGRGQGINVDETIKKYFIVGLNRHYYNERNNSLRITYELIIKDFFTVNQTDSKGKEVPIIKTPSNLPTYNQFLYWYKQLNNPKKELIKRKGERKYNQKHRTIIGDSTQDAGLGPGTLWQIDATQFDIYLVSSMNRNIIVGRPTLILIIDVYSRMIVGCNVSLEPFNSYTGAMVALANAMLPKENYCKQFAVTIDKNEWDIGCIPQRVFADRGELNNKQIENAITNLGISIQNSPPYRADYKGIIEQAFEQLNIQVKPFVDGVVNGKSNVIERGEVDYRLKSNLTINEFTKIIIKCVLFHNNHHVLSQYVLDDMMIEESVEKTPAKIWAHGLKNTKGRLRTLPETTIKMHLLPTAIASVTSRGVKFKKMLYASDYSLKNNWYQDARIEGARKIKIWFDPRDLWHIHVINEDGEFHKLTLLEHLTKFKGKGIEEINEIIKFEDALDSKSREKELQAKMELFNDIENIVEMGREETLAEKDDSLSKRQRLIGIRDNQRMERELQREIVRKENENIKVDEGIETEISTDDHDNLELFRAIQEEERGYNNE